MWKRSSRKRELTCQQVKAQLLAYLDGKLSPARQQAIRAHLAVCDACARSAREIEDMEARLFTAAARHRPRLSPQASARIQERVYRRMRVALVVRRATQWAGSAVGLIVVLALALRLLALWQWEPVVTEGPGGIQDLISHTPAPITPTPVERPQSDIATPTITSTPVERLPRTPTPVPPTPVEMVDKTELDQEDVETIVAREARAARLSVAVELLAGQPGLERYHQEAERYLVETYGPAVRSSPD